MTARRLIAELSALGVRVQVERAEIAWTAEADDPPDHLVDALTVLGTGVRAVLTGRRWFGFDAATGKACGPDLKAGGGLLAYGALDTGSKLPPNVGYLCVEGDAVWDRIDPDARRRTPFLFAIVPGRDDAVGIPVAPRARAA